MPIILNTRHAMVAAIPTNSRSVAIGAEDGIVVRSSQPDQKKIDPKIPNKEKRMTMAMWLDGSFGCDVFIV